jgi:hypothetical protein
MNKERPWWHRLGTLIFTVVTAVVLFKATGVPNLASAPVSQWVICAVCGYGLGQIYDVLFDVVAAIVDAKSRQHARTRQAVRGG